MKLQRKLAPRHINLMALGSTIGVGLFLGAASTIQQAGPAVLLSYIVAGLVIFFILRALGEMTLHDPVSGSFSRYAHNYLGPLAGYLTGWNYWFLWMATCMTEITAIGIYMQMWYPGTPQWAWALASLAGIGLINFFSVKWYGEFEFWFSLVKIVTIVLMIMAGVGMIFWGLGNHGVATGIRNLYTHGGFIPHGFGGMAQSMTLVMYAYLGIEMIGIAAGESQNPKKSITRAINSVFWRILIFYVGSLLVMMCIYPWNQIGTQGSPFVMIFEKIGIPSAAGIINFVVITAALSSCNGGVFSCTRMLHNLAQQRQAPPCFSQVSSRGVPVLATLLSLAALLIGVASNYLAPQSVFIILSAVATFAALWTWCVILLAQLKFRRQMSADDLGQIKHTMPFWPYSSYVCLLFLALIVCLMAYQPQTRIALYVGAGWVILLTLIYAVQQWRRRARLPAPQAATQSSDN